MSMRAPCLQVLSDPDTLKIGIQIRSGDQTFRDGNDRATMEFFAAFFDCAEQVEKSRRHSKDQKVRCAAGACRCFVLLCYVHTHLSGSPRYPLPS